MPGNAAAERGFGLSAGEAFGGEVGTGNVSPSAVGGTFGGFGPDMGSPADNPAQAGRFGLMGTPNSVATAASVQALADRGRALANAAAAARGMLGKSASQLGIGSIVSAQQAVNATVDAFGTISPSAIADIAEETGVSSQAVAAMAAQAVSQQAAQEIGRQVDVDAAMNRGGLQSGNFGPGLLGGTVSSADLASGNMSTTGIPGATGTVSTNAAGNISPAQASGMVSAIDPLSGGSTRGTNTGINTSVDAPDIANDMAALAAAQAPAVAPMSVDIPAMVPSVQPAQPPAMVAPTQTNVTPAQIAQSMTTNTTPAKSTGIFSRNQDLPAYNERGLLGKIGMDLAMGLSINPFASREDQAQSLASRGYSQADIDGYFGRTDANVAATNAAVENSVGSRDYVSDEQLRKYGQSLSPQKSVEFDRMTRQQQLQAYYKAMGY